MKAWHVLALLLIGLTTMGSSCINDDVVVVANATIEETFLINPGTTTSGGETDTIVVSNILPESFDPEDLTDVNAYDVKVFASGDYNGSFSGSIRVNGALLATVTNAPWDELQKPLSLLIGSPYLTYYSAGKIALDAALQAYKLNDAAELTVRLDWSVSESPVPPGLSVTVQLLSQVTFTVAIEGD